MAVDESAEVTASSEREEPLVPEQPIGRAPFEAALLLASLLAAACAAAAVVGSLKGWTSPTLGAVFVFGWIEALVAVSLAVRVLLLEEKRIALFLPGAVLAAAATASLTGIFLLSGSI